VTIQDFERHSLLRVGDGYQLIEGSSHHAVEVLNIPLCGQGEEVCQQGEEMCEQGVDVCEQAKKM
jgi:hypothetical protein